MTVEDTKTYVCRSEFLKALGIDELVHEAKSKHRTRSQHEWRHRAQYVVEQWRNFYINHDDLLRTRLAQWGLSDTDELETILSTPPSAPETIAALDFVEELDDILRNWPSSREDVETLPDVDAIVEPICNHMRQRVFNEMSRLSTNAEQISASFMSTTPASFVDVIRPLVALEANILRVTDDDAETSARTYFQQAVENIRSAPDVAASFFRRYPVAARALVDRSRQWANAAVEFTTRMIHDQAALSEWSATATALPILNVEHGSGDTHCRGRATCIVTLNDGTLVAYKPRTLGPVRQALNFVKMLTPGTQLNVPDFIDRRDYGWTKLVKHSTSHGHAQLSKYYYTLGQTTAALWLLGATDMHSENIVASGSVPYLVDLETLLTPDFGNPERWTNSINAQARKANLLRSLPVSVGILPYISGGSGETMGLDMSAFGDLPGQRYVSSDGVWVEKGTGRMRLDKQEVVRGRLPNQPWPEEADVDTELYHDDLIAGFLSVTNQAAENLKSHAIIDVLTSQLHDGLVRVVTRPSSLYAELIRESNHPDSAQDALLRDLNLEILWASCEVNPKQVALLPAELDDLRNGDIPIHYSRLDSRSLFGWEGAEHPNFAIKSPIERIQQNLTVVSSGKYTERLVQSVTLTLKAHEENRRIGEWDVSIQDLPDEDITNSRLIELASKVGDRIISLGWETANDGLTWLTASPRSGLNWDLRIVGDNVYDGVAGISIFLQELARVTEHERYHDAFRKVTNAWITEVPFNVMRTVGAFEGLGGALYRAAILDEELFPEKADLLTTILDRMENLVASDNLQYDVLGGIAGAALSLVRAGDILPAVAGVRAKQLADAYGRRLTEEALHLEHGVAWPRSNSDSRYLLGFSHGNAGIAYVLRLLAAKSSTVALPTEFLECAQQAEALENSHYDKKAGNWADLRDVPGAGYSFSWCNGSVGIGIGRALSLKESRVDDRDARQLRVDLSNALASAESGSLGGGHTLCHGDSGLAELFLFASEATELPEMYIKARCVAAKMARDCFESESQPRTGHRFVREALGLLNGSSGTAYQLLRVADPDSVPSILTLGGTFQW